MNKSLPLTAVLTPLALLLAAAPASAQVSLGTPDSNVPPPSVNLDPGAANDYTGPVPQPQQQQSQQPNVVVVGPDGKITSNLGSGSGGPSGYYAGEGGGGFGRDDERYSTVHNGPIPELHVVRSGDTLWDICWYYFNDPWQWPKIWSYNAQITNPHWIYPGDLVRLVPRGAGAVTPQPQAPAQPELPVQTGTIGVGLRQLAFVEQSDLEKSIEIDGAVDEKTLLSAGDSVYLSYPKDHPPQVGQRYSIYRPGNPVKANGHVLGAYVEIMGVVEVASVKQDKRARGVIIDATRELERGLKVGPLVTTYKTVPARAPEVDAQGNIIAMLTADQLIGQGQLVMVDLGKDSGVQVGNRMYVVRRGDALPPSMSLTVAQDDRRFPARALGDVVIVQVGDKISVGLVTLAVQEMGVGDIVMMQKAAQ